MNDDNVRVFAGMCVIEAAGRIARVMATDGDVLHLAGPDSRWRGRRDKWRPWRGDHATELILSALGECDLLADLRKQLSAAKEEARTLRNEVRAWELRDYKCEICGEVMPGKWRSNEHASCREKQGWGY